MEIIFGLVFLLLTFATFGFWLKPEGLFGPARLQQKTPFIAASLAVLFFVACFTVGCWVSILELKGSW